MAINPMQRRARNSFLIGFLVALVIMAVVVFILLFQIKSINEAKAKLEALQKSVLVASDDLKSGQEVTLEDNFTTTKIQTTIDPEKVVSDLDFEYTNKDGEPVTMLDDKGAEKKKKMVMKIAVPAGTIITKDMLVEEENQTTDSTRVQEYNMIVLPSQLVNGDYIDIRMSLANGQDYIVLSKKLVLGTNETTVWLQLSEEEILTLSNAIVETYTFPGAKLYAIQYVEPGLQDESIPTYTVSEDVLALINSDPNIVKEARDNLWSHYVSENRTNYFEPLRTQNLDSQGSLVSAGNSSEIESIKAARQEFVENLEGTEDVGYTR